MLLVLVSQILPRSRWISVSAEAEMGFPQQSFASTGRNPGLTVVKNLPPPASLLPISGLKSLSVTSTQLKRLTQGQLGSRTSPTTAAEVPHWSEFTGPYPARNLDLLGCHRGPRWAWPHGVS